MTALVMQRCVDGVPKAHYLSPSSTSVPFSRSAIAARLVSRLRGTHVGVVSGPINNANVPNYEKAGIGGRRSLAVEEPQELSSTVAPWPG